MARTSARTSMGRDPASHGLRTRLRSTAAWITEDKSEDCLYLNIWAPTRSGAGKLPVIVWIHGGGFYGRSGAQPLYDGPRLARRGVIVVTINCRL